MKCVQVLIALVVPSAALKVAPIPAGTDGRCRHVPLSLAKRKALRDRRLPGAGMEPGKLEPFKTAYFDGYLDMGCHADYLFAHGDKFGDQKFAYELGNFSNVSIVHYSSHVAKEDREPMTRDLCFNFCRTIKDMHTFGVTNGRECYCSAYFKPVADDSSLCDAPCDGDNSVMCGGKTKSDVFNMHACANMAADLEAAFNDINAALMGDESFPLMHETHDFLQKEGERYQEMFGQAGDAAAADLAQTAKVFAGELEKESEKKADMVESANGLLHASKDMQASDFKSAANVKKGEEMLDKMSDLMSDFKAFQRELKGLSDEARPDRTYDASDGAAKQYYSAMYFVDKAFVSNPSTCGGDAAARPLVGSLDTCARACDKDLHDCVGFSFLPNSGSAFPGASDTTAGGTCFLMSKLKTMTYYTGCHAEIPTPAVKCYVKFSKMDGATLKPDPSGKCDMCLKEATKADRCFA